MSTLSDRDAEEVRRIARRHGAVRVRVFGSYATGAASESSDLDLLDLIAVKQDLEAALGRSVDVAEEGGLSPYLRDRILLEARPL